MKITKEGEGVSNQPRITVEKGIEAYHVSGATPIRGQFTSVNKGIKYACGLGAFVLATPGMTFMGLGDSYMNYFGSPYTYGFIEGFDEGNVTVSDLMRKMLRFQEGVEDGKALWEAVKNGLPPNKESEVKKLVEDLDRELAELPGLEPVIV